MNSSISVSDSSLVSILVEVKIRLLKFGILLYKSLTIFFCKSDYRNNLEASLSLFEGFCRSNIGSFKEISLEVDGIVVAIIGVLLIVGPVSGECD